MCMCICTHIYIYIYIHINVTHIYIYAAKRGSTRVGNRGVTTRKKKAPKQDLIASKKCTSEPFCPKKFLAALGKYKLGPHVLNWASARDGANMPGFTIKQIGVKNRHIFGPLVANNQS